MTGLVAVAAAIGMIAAAQEVSKTGSISGRVVDALSGEPVPKASVFIEVPRAGSLGATSDSQGRFSIADVPPGNYYLYIDRSRYVVTCDLRQQVTIGAGEAKSGVVFKVMRTGVIAGRVFDVDGDPAVNATVTVVPVGGKPGQFGGPPTTTDDRGQYRLYSVSPGKYKVATAYSARGIWSNARIRGRTKEGEPRLEYPAVFHPSAADESQAGVVRVESGAEVAGVDIRLLRVRAVRVRGRAQTPAPLPERAHVSMDPVNRHESPNPGRSYTCPIDNETGAFECADVVPGRYRATFVSRTGEPPQVFQARQSIHVQDTDVEDVELVASLPLSVTGRIVLPAGRRLPDRVAIGLLLRDSADSWVVGSGGIAHDGTFTLGQVWPGEYDFLVAGLHDGAGAEDLYVDSIRAGSDDVLANGFRLMPGPERSLEVVVKANGGSVDVSVDDGKGSPVPECNVVLNPGPRGRHCETRADGKCTITGIRPGAYELYAFDQSADINLRDAEAMKRVEKFAVRVRVAERERKSTSATVITE